MNVVKIGNSEIELRVAKSLEPSVVRTFAGATPLDAEIDALAIPAKPAWLRVCIGLIRWYRRIRSRRIGQRCVFDPSCSRYSELAFRKHGFVGGAVAMLKRLHRCGPEAGGVDIP